MDTLERLQKIDRSQELDGFAIRLYFFSRDPWKLAGLAFVILAIAAGLGWWLQAPPEKADGSPTKALRAELALAQPDAAHVLELLPQASESVTGFALGDFSSLDDVIRNSKLAPADKQVALALHESLFTGTDEPSADLLWLAHQYPPVPRANEVLGNYHLAARRFAEALPYFQREGRRPEAHDAREKVLLLLAEKKDYAALKQHLASPLYAEEKQHAMQVILAGAERRWLAMIQPLVALSASNYQAGPVALALVAGLVWYLVGLQALQPKNALVFRLVAPVIAVILGMMSTIPTLMAGEWQAQVQGLTQGKGLIGDILFYVAGVGVREELVKLIFFLPFVPVLLMRKDRLETLMLAGFVGLGFAIEENLQYFREYGSLAAFGRFLTANFFHLALTGLVGYSFVEAIRSPLRRGWVFPLTLAAMILSHGLYDAALAVGGGIPLFQIISSLFFILTSLFFFRTLRPLRDPATDQLNIAFTLIVGLAVLVGYIFVAAAREVGFEAAALLLSVHFFSLCMIAYMFYWQLGEGMSVEGQEAHRPAYAL